MAAFDDIDLSMDELEDENTGKMNSEIDVDLEKYGVWVKTGPEDIDEAEDNADNNFELEDLNTDDGFEENNTLTDEEEELLGTLEISETEELITEESFELEEELPDLSRELDIPEDQDIENNFSFDDIADSTLPTAEEENTIIDELSFEETDFSTELPELDLEDETDILNKKINVLEEEEKEEEKVIEDNFSDLDALEADLTDVEEDFSDSISSLKEAAGTPDL
jgi:hypothetical protein